MQILCNLLAGKLDWSREAHWILLLHFYQHMLYPRDLRLLNI